MIIKDNREELAELVREGARWYAVASCGEQTVKRQVSRHIMSLRDEAAQKWHLQVLARDLRKRLNRKLIAAGERPLPKVPSKGDSQ